LAVFQWIFRKSPIENREDGVKNVFGHTIDPSLEMFEEFVVIQEQGSGAVEKAFEPLGRSFGLMCGLEISADMGRKVEFIS